MTSAVSRARGRPSKYSEALADEICDLLKSGESMIAICDRPGMPDRVTVLGWEDRYPAFSTKLFLARSRQADLCDDQMIEIAKNTSYETSAADTLKFNILRWRAARLNAKRYGDKTELTNTVKHEVTHIHLVAPESDQVETTIDADFTLLPHPLEQQDDD